jgi:hypothetical protein
MYNPSAKSIIGIRYFVEKNVLEIIYSGSSQNKKEAMQLKMLKFVMSTSLFTLGNRLKNSNLKYTIWFRMV